MDSLKFNLSEVTEGLMYSLRVAERFDGSKAALLRIVNVVEPVAVGPLMF